MSRLERLAAATLYAICDIDGLARMPLAEIDVLQLRDKHADRASLLDAALRARVACDQHDVLLIVNDDPQLAVEVDADGAHVGQDDINVPAAREILGAERLLGLSTHTPTQIDAATGVDYIGVGPVHATPTKPGRSPVGLDLVAYAATHADVPWFAIGGIDTRNVADVRRAGATRIAVVRAIGDAADPVAAARSWLLPSEGRKSSEQRAEELRAQLEPYGPGERPLPLVIACIVCVVLVAINLGMLVSGYKITGRGSGPTGAILFAAIVLAAAVGMWQLRYWAVLGFQALLSLTVLIAALALVVASNVEAVLLCTFVIGCGGWLFWKLVRVMARIQLPDRR